MDLTDKLDRQSKQFYQYVFKSDGGGEAGCWRWYGSPAYAIDGVKYSPIRAAMLFMGYTMDYRIREIHDKDTCEFDDCMNPTHKEYGRHLSPAELAAEVSSAPVSDQRAKLNSEAIRDIRYAYDVLGESQTSLADLYGVSQPNINAIVNRRTWAHITDD